MMIRRLFACLALITGLAAAGTPAEAAMGAAVSFHSQSQAASTCESAEHYSAHYFGHVARKPHRAAFGAAQPAYGAGLLRHCSVYLRADRARE